MRHIRQVASSSQRFPGHPAAAANQRWGCLTSAATTSTKAVNPVPALRREASRKWPVRGSPPRSQEALQLPSHGPEARTRQSARAPCFPLSTASSPACAASALRAGCWPSPSPIRLLRSHTQSHSRADEVGGAWEPPALSDRPDAARVVHDRRTATSHHSADCMRATCRRKLTCITLANSGLAARHAAGSSSPAGQVTPARRRRRRLRRRGRRPRRSHTPPQSRPPPPGGCGPAREPQSTWPQWRCLQGRGRQVHASAALALTDAAADGARLSPTRWRTLLARAAPQVAPPLGEAAGLQLPVCVHEPDVVLPMWRRVWEQQR